LERLRDGNVIPELVGVRLKKGSASIRRYTGKRIRRSMDGKNWGAIMAGNPFTKKEGMAMGVPAEDLSRLSEAVCSSPPRPACACPHLCVGG